MGLYKGYKLKDVTKTQRFELRMTSDELSMLDHCAKELHLTRSEVLLSGLKIVNKSIEKRG